MIEPQLSEAQCGFMKGRGTVDQIWMTRQVEYTTAGGLFLTYRDQTEATTLIHDVLYADDHHWGEDQSTHSWRPKAAYQTPITLRNCTLEDVTTFSYLGNWKSREGSGYKDRESWDGVPDLETKSLSQLQAQ